MKLLNVEMGCMGKMSVNGVIGSEYLFHRLWVEEMIAKEEEVEVAVEGEGEVGAVISGQKRRLKTWGPQLMMRKIWMLL